MKVGFVMHGVTLKNRRAERKRLVEMGIRGEGVGRV